MTENDLQTPQIFTATAGAPRARPETVSRARVRALLDGTRAQRLTLVCAPAGYGKTTALVDWFGTLEEARAWVSLGE